MITQGRSGSAGAIAAPAAAPAARAVRASWIHRPVVDVAVAFAWIPFAIVTHLLEPNRIPLDIFVTSVFLLSFAHQPLTLALVYGDREQYRLRRAIFTWSPIVFVVAIFIGVQISMVLVAVIGGLWNAEHTLMQRYGICRIYGRKVGEDKGTIEKLLLFSWLVVALVWVAADVQTPARLDTVNLGQNNRLGVEFLSKLQPAAAWVLLPVVAVSIGLAVRWFVLERRRVQEGEGANPAKWLYLGSTAALFAVILVDPLAGVMGYVGAHAIEYFVIVHQSLGRRYGDPATGGASPIARAVRAKPGRIGFFAIYISAIIGVVAALQWSKSALAYAIVFFTLGGLHVFYDGFIWKLRTPKVASSLAIPPPPS